MSLSSSLWSEEEADGIIIILWCMVCIICNLFRVPCERDRFSSELTDAIAFERETAVLADVEDVAPTDDTVDDALCEFRLDVGLMQTPFTFFLKNFNFVQVKNSQRIERKRKKKKRK